ncbi:ATP phosphoribosyltransferase regulatory subunit, partial [Adlercreutzia mucosicola]|uniref:ATP phosphoribosyltransferase regulatory subunit n=1 Tax=Adlercreutzia mucosicola TaxID=580026 RepID=UPI002B2437D6
MEVSEKASKIVRTPEMKKTLEYLLKVYRILKIYGLEKNIVMDLGLINHMGYYSDVIFQGFVGKFGKPVLMGGRYNHLGNEFGANLPAIGFACEVESLVLASATDIMPPRTPIDVTIVYVDERLEESITISNELRERNYSV